MARKIEKAVYAVAGVSLAASLVINAPALALGVGFVIICIIADAKDRKG